MWNSNTYKNLWKTALSSIAVLTIVFLSSCPVKASVTGKPCSKQDQQNKTKKLTANYRQSANCENYVVESVLAKEPNTPQVNLSAGLTFLSTDYKFHFQQQIHSKKTLKKTSLKKTQALYLIHRSLLL